MSVVLFIASVVQNKEIPVYVGISHIIFIKFSVTSSNDRCKWECYNSDILNKNIIYKMEHEYERFR